MDLFNFSKKCIVNIVRAHPILEKLPALQDAVIAHFQGLIDGHYAYKLYSRVLPLGKAPAVPHLIPQVWGNINTRIDDHCVELMQGDLRIRLSAMLGGEHRAFDPAQAPSYIPSASIKEWTRHLPFVAADASDLEIATAVATTANVVAQKATQWRAASFDDVTRVIRAGADGVFNRPKDPTVGTDRAPVYYDQIVGKLITRQRRAENPQEATDVMVTVINELLARREHLGPNVVMQHIDRALPRKRIIS